MSRLFPHPAYAEDQPLPKTILTTHVMTRAVTTGTIIGGGIFAVQELIRTLRSSSSSIPPPLLPRSQRFLRVAGSSTVWTLAVMAVLLPVRMWGREEIEWKDRSWRLMENKGQLETDDWTYAGMAGGLVAAVVGRPRAGWRAVVGSVGVGSFAGMLGYMGWRYGVNGGKFPGDERKSL